LTNKVAKLDYDFVLKNSKSNQNQTNSF